MEQLQLVIRVAAAPFYATLEALRAAGCTSAPSFIPPDSNAFEKRLHP